MAQTVGILEENPHTLNRLYTLLSARGDTPTAFSDAAQFAAVCAANPDPFDFMIIDLSLRNYFQCKEIIKQLNAHHSGMPILVTSSMRLSVFELLVQGLDLPVFMQPLLIPELLTLIQGI